MNGMNVLYPTEENRHGRPSQTARDRKTKPGDVSERVGVEQIRARGVNVEQLIEKLIDAAGAEFTTYYYYTILRMYLAGHEDYKEICEDARLEDRAHFELITPRIYELGGSHPQGHPRVRRPGRLPRRLPAGRPDRGRYPDGPAGGGGTAPSAPGARSAT